MNASHVNMFRLGFDYAEAPSQLGITISEYVSKILEPSGYPKKIDQLDLRVESFNQLDSLPSRWSPHVSRSIRLGQNKFSVRRIDSNNSGVCRD